MNAPGDVPAYPDALSLALSALRDLAAASLADCRAATYAEATFAQSMIGEAAEFDEVSHG